MLKLLLIVFIIIPFGIWFGTLIANLVSIVLMTIAVFVGGLGHKIIKGNQGIRWHPPEYVALIQILIIYGFIFSVYANVIGGAFDWHWLLNIGVVLRNIFAALLVFDLLVLMVLATIHGPFDLLGD